METGSSSMFNQVMRGALRLCSQAVEPTDCSLRNGGLRWRQRITISLWVDNKLQGTNTYAGRLHPVFYITGKEHIVLMKDMHTTLAGHSSSKEIGR